MGEPPHRHRNPLRRPAARIGSARSPRSVAGQVFLLQIVLIALLVTAATVAQVIQTERDGQQKAERQSVAVAGAFANAPGVSGALGRRDPSAALQPYAEAARKKAGVDFLVVMNKRGIRYTHPDADAIGKRFNGSIKPSLAGRTVVEEATGPVLRGGQQTVQAVVPVTDRDGSVVGLVSAGLTVQNVSGMAEGQLPLLFSAGAGALVLSVAGAGLVTRRLRRQTHGLGPAEMTRMFEHHDAVLHAVREGVLIIGPDSRLLLANDEARRLLGLTAGAEQQAVAELDLDSELTQLLTSGGAVTDEVHQAAGRLLAVNKRPTAPYGGQSGSVVTLRDTTELATVSGRAEVARERLKLLYESGVRIGTTLDVTHTARELAAIAVPQFADIATVDLLDEVIDGQEPTSRTGWRLRRVAVSGGQPHDLPVSPEEDDSAGFRLPAPETQALQEGRAVLAPDLQRAEEWRAQDPERTRRVLELGLRSMVLVPLRARGVTLGIAHFWRTAESPAFDQDDVSFSEELAARASVAIDNARRFTREHAMAVTLQQSLLPRGLPEHETLETAWRYLPAEAGVGGDWFDVIPLSGARLALVVGDVVGHGLHAAATMGRLRTAVHNFSALDLPGDELLGHLEELILRIDSEDSAEGGAAAAERAEIVGATCLYAIYDPVAGTCAVTRAGHPGPAVAYPDGTVTYPDVPVSPPLGAGGHPFETVELPLPEGSRIVLYTDGLIEDRHRDIDVGLETLRGALQETSGSNPEETCEAVTDALVPSHPSDDIALLVGRTRLLDPSKVAQWQVPQDPAAVAPVRAECAERLREWGLEDSGYTTELILSELITNAVRYGKPPITVRLLHNRSLICEVSDGSSTSPHLRRAAITDEGGRGLFLVAQLAERWGTRYTSEGKVIWTEQALHGGQSQDAGMSPDDLMDQFDEPL